MSDRLLATLAARASAWLPDWFREFLHDKWHGITGLQWIVATTIVVVGTTVLALARGLLIGRLRRLAARSKTDVDDFFVSLVERTRVWFFALLMLRAATLVLDLSQRWDDRAQILLIVGGMIQGGLWAAAVVRFAVDRRFARHVHDGAPTDPRVVPVAQTLLRFAGLVIVWAITVLAILSAFGIDITALVAGLGIGGVALALAVQKVLGDILASISIAVDKPFAPGDYIVVGQQQGTVRRIGIRSTVIGSLGGEELVIANNDLLGARIQNYTRMTERRVGFTVRVVYDSDPARLAGLSTLLRAAIDGREQVRFDRATLASLGEWGLEYEIVYWMTTASYDVYARVHEQILLDIVARMHAEGYAFAFTTRRVVSALTPEAAAAGA